MQAIASMIKTLRKLFAENPDYSIGGATHTSTRSPRSDRARFFRAIYKYSDGIQASGSACNASSFAPCRSNLQLHSRWLLLAQATARVRSV